MTAHAIAAAIAGAMAGGLAGLFGVGGNAVLVPLLVLFLALPQQDAQGLTLAATLPPLSLPALLYFRSHGTAIPWRAAVLAAAGFVAAIPLGSVAANRLPAAALRILFAGILLFNASRIWRRGSVAAAARASATEGAAGAREGRGNGTAATEPPIAVGARLAPWLIASGMGAGLASGLLGIGGALILIPALRALGFGQRQAQVTSLAVLLAPIGLPGVLVYAAERPGIEWWLILPVAVAFVAGSLGGARLAQRMAVHKLERSFALYMVVMAVTMLALAALRPTR